MATVPVTPVPTRVKAARAKNGTKSTHHSTVINFTESEDIQLYEYLEQQAKKERRQLGVFILLALHNAFPNEVAE